MTEQTNHRGANVRALRQLCGLTQQALAARSGLGRDEISSLETGRRQGTSARVVQALARGFGLTMEQTVALLDGTLTASVIKKVK
jgi:transcriptional regulator with XRE-family HTH domain